MQNARYWAGCLFVLLQRTGARGTLEAGTSKKRQSRLRVGHAQGARDETRCDGEGRDAIGYRATQRRRAAGASGAAGRKRQDATARRLVDVILTAPRRSCPQQHAHEHPLNHPRFCRIQGRTQDTKHLPGTNAKSISKTNIFSYLTMLRWPV